MEPGVVLLDLPFRGRWMAVNSPARRVPSHGTHLFGTTYAIDFVAVDASGRSAPQGWRSWLWTEPPEGFVGFGAPVLAPAAGTVVATHDGETDHAARRSPVSLVPYALGQARRARSGPSAIAGNHVCIALGPRGPYVWLVHLRRGTIEVHPGQQVEPGRGLARCGNSGNSTEPHLHVQVTDSATWSTARGLPMAFRAYRAGDGRAVAEGMPGEREIVEPA